MANDIAACSSRDSGGLVDDENRAIRSSSSSNGAVRLYAERFMVRDSLSFICFRSLDTGAMN